MPFPQLNSGTYGRTDLSQCVPDGAEAISEEPCEGVSVFDLPALSQCEGRENCQIPVSAQDLGQNPCPERGYTKYLNVSFTCISECVFLTRL